MNPIHEQGYLIPALDTDSTDYLSCARGLALSIRQHHPAARIAVMTQTACDDPVFDHVVGLPFGDCGNGANHQCNDWQVFWATPFRETIKLEADMLMASPCDHWWTMLRHRDLYVSTGCRTWQDQFSTARTYRRIFDVNDLPDVYNAITYWRLSATAKEFFDLVRDIFQQWSVYRRTIRFAEDQPSTDVVYAMAAKIMGYDRVTMPFVSYPHIVHMKAAHAATQRQDWTEELVWETDPLRVQTLAQWGAFHYHVKHWQPR